MEAGWRVHWSTFEPLIANEAILLVQRGDSRNLGGQYNWSDVHRLTCQSGGSSISAQYRVSRGNQGKVIPMDDTPPPARILVADDDRATRFAISSMLKNAGYAVNDVENG